MTLKAQEISVELDMLVILITILIYSKLMLIANLNVS